MRGLEVLLGGVLVAAGVFAPIGPFTDAGEAGGDGQGRVSFIEADYEGQADVRTSNAALQVFGDLEATTRATAVDVTLHEFKKNQGVVRVGDTSISQDHAYDDQVSRDQFTNATIRIDDWTPYAVVYAWPNASLGPAEFHLSLDASQGATLSASAHGADFEFEKGHEHRIPAPAIGLGHGRSDFESAQLNQATFDHLNATGGLNLIVTDAEITVEEDGRTVTYHTKTGEGERGALWDPEGNGVCYAVGAESSYAVISLKDANMTLGFEDTTATVFTHSPTWRIDGALALEAREGHVVANEEKEHLEEDKLQMEGNTTLDVRAEGTDDGSDMLPVRVPRETLPRPTLQGTFETDADKVYVNGQPVRTAEPHTTVPEEATLAAKILGALFLAWSLGKKYLFVVVRLFSRDPLKNGRRKRIYEFLGEARMAHMREIHRATGIPMGSLAYHLRILRGAGLVASVRWKRYRVYFMPEADLTWDEMRRLAVLADPTRREIADAVLHGDSVSQGSLVERLDLTQSAVSRQLKKLVEAGLVEPEPGPIKRYTATDVLRKWVQGT